jgi:nudix-type nucleoside diphosphatase (YffH/AdpP family)
LPAEIVRIRAAYEGWTKLLIATIRDSEGSQFNREIEDHGRAVSVLPYDPERRTALLVRILRAPVLYAGSDDILEAPAGMMDEDDPADAVRREAFEEVGLQLREIEHIARTFSSPGVSSETIDLYLAPYSSADRVGPGGGLAEENESITVVEIALSAMWAMVENQELADLKTLALLFALRHRRPDLFT